MEYTRLGATGLRVSRLALGCMTYGDPNRGLHRWTLDEAASAPFFRQAVELGITFWDTANVYQQGSGEEYVGRAIKRFSRREDIVLATKVSGRMHDGPGGSGLSRTAILEQVDASLRRLGTDHIDVYYVHRFDEETPVEETMRALDDVVRAGKVRYLGASSMYAWQFAKLQTAAAVHGLTPFVAMENQYNLLKREEEREMIPMCADTGVGLTPYSPNGKGRLARPRGAATNRSNIDEVAKAFDTDADGPIIDAVEEIAVERGIPMAQVALAWVLRNPTVAAPIIGATRPAHLTDAAAALDVQLTDDEVARLESPYVTQAPFWW
ncbi:Predicted oxidoreductase [Plantibacter flavus]|uniref:Aryl-alcohol dehydrogenase-like predicted oxidoreductase n=1 Tax=Plantibacter flavus TaxID=150123 RepID=A0A3N2C540_9MICO|nr:aldo/keto reductase [Plantibacter flavus]ROR82638.1 aryl-alcohol dehydrogenase-like predicted oxidoreductase [Plantibacter flavus]SMG39136.1 Predicted oxidoreductase [Plantibacter flavus]